MPKEGGQLVLINATPYAWNTKSQSQYQMNAWKFPASISPRAVTSVYVEWNEGLLTTISDDGGDVQFQLDGLSNTFSLHARAPNKNFNIQVSFDNLATVNNPAGTTLNLGWNHNSNMPFILSGSSGNFWSTNPPSAWMHGMLPVIGSRPLRQIVTPGSHDAGMSSLTGRTVGGVNGNILTQSQNIAGQLSAGARYFDLRPVIANGQFSTGHYSYIDSVLNWQGGDGEMFDDIIAQINAFTANNAELIVLNLSHDLDTDAAGGQYEFLTQDQYNSLLMKLTSLNNLYIADSPTTVDLTTLTLNDFIGKGRAAVVVVCDPSTSSITLGDYSKKGFYTASQLNPVNLYSNSDDLMTMANDQLAKLGQYRPTASSPMFLLSWTLTQQVSDMTKLTSIKDLAAQADNALYALVVPKISAQTFPNILYVDNFADSSITALAVAMNHLVSPAVSGRDVNAAARRHLVQSRHRFANKRQSNDRQADAKEKAKEKSDKETSEKRQSASSERKEAAKDKVSDKSSAPEVRQSSEDIDDKKDDRRAKAGPGKPDTSVATARRQLVQDFHRFARKAQSNRDGRDSDSYATAAVTAHEENAMEGKRQSDDEDSMADDDEKKDDRRNAAGKSAAKEDDSRKKRLAKLEQKAL